MVEVSNITVSEILKLKLTNTYGPSSGDFEASWTETFKVAIKVNTVTSGADTILFYTLINVTAVTPIL